MTTKLKTLILCIALIVSVAQCTIPKIKFVKFRGNSNAVMAELTALAAFKEAGFTSGASVINGVTTYSLNLKLVNGENFSDAEAMKGVAEKAARIVAGSVENVADFSSLTIEIVDQTSIGIASKSSTREYSFSREDMESIQKQQADKAVTI